MRVAKEDAQAASIAKLGPCKSKRLETLPATTLANSPGIVSSLTRGAPVLMASTNASPLAVGMPNDFANSLVWLE